MPYQQYTLAQLQAHLAARVDTSPYWTAAEATAALNEALRVWNSLVGQWRRREYIFTVNGPWHALSASLLFTTRISWNGITLDSTTLADLDLARSHWEGESITDGGDVPTQPQVWAPVGLYKVAIWPMDWTPAHRYLIDGVAETPVLAAAGDYINIGEEHLSAITGYALHTLAFKQGGTTFAASLGLFKDFLREALAANDRLRSSAVFRRVAGLDQNLGYVPRRTAPPAGSLEVPA